MATVGAEVGVTVGSDELQAVVFCLLDPPFQLRDLAGQPVEVVADDLLELARLVVGLHALVGEA